MKDEHLKNYIHMITELVHSDYHGEITTTFNRGVITMAGKKDKIKFDNQNFKEYKDRIDNNLI